MKSVKNQVGLEAEFFLYDSGDNLVFPRKFGFSTDDFELLGEFRASPGNTREETLGNFFTEYYKVLFKAQKLNLCAGLTTAMICPK